MYGSPRVFLDLREAGERCGRHRVARIMRSRKIKALRGYKAPRPIAGRPSIIAPNRLQREFTVEKPDQVWVTDITYIRTWQGWLYLAVVMDLYARRIVGWSMKPTLAREIVLDAILMAVWRRQPRGTLIHSDQGSQYGSDDWLRFCREHHLEPSMSRRGNCWDNAVAESFFSSLKKERDQKTHLQDARSGEGRRLRLHRDVLQSNAPSRPSGRRQSRGLRECLKMRLGSVLLTERSPKLLGRDKPPLKRRLRPRVGRAVSKFWRGLANVRGPDRKRTSVLWYHKVGTHNV